MAKKQLDKSKPFNGVRSLGKERYAQGGFLFDANGVECGKDNSYIDPVVEEQAAAVDETAAAAPAPSPAEERLGDFGGASSPQPTDAADEEDAAMRQAETQAD